MSGSKGRIELYVDPRPSPSPGSPINGWRGGAGTKPSKPGLHLLSMPQ